MTTAIASTLKLELADSADILKVLREQYLIWGAGLNQEQYRHWLDRQMSHPWARRHFRFFVLREQRKIVAAAKVYLLDAQARGKRYKIAGIGAVYTMQAERGRGYGSELMNKLTNLAKAEHLDGLLLYSDIDPSFYENVGYTSLSDHEFYIWCNDPAIERQIMADDSFVEDLHEHSPELSTVELNNVSEMVTHHTRYLATVPFGIRRSEHYWDFKLSREQFLQDHSVHSRPPFELLSVDMHSPAGGYAVFEQSGKIMRVLEVIGRPDTREALWRNLLRAALLRRVQLIRGWESNAPTFVKGLRYIQRDVARPMFRPLNRNIESWETVVPCPLLELDHF